MKKEELVAVLEAGEILELGTDVETGSRMYLWRSGDQTRPVEDQKLVRDLVNSGELVTDDSCQCGITEYRLSN